MMNRPSACFISGTPDWTSVKFGSGVSHQKFLGE